MDTAMKTVTEGSPLIVVDGSGQAADVIAYAYHLIHDVDKESGSVGMSSLGLIFDSVPCGWPAGADPELVFPAREPEGQDCHV